MSSTPPTSAWQATAWTCAMCQHCNLAGETCEVCGVARRFLDDPPLDLPHTPSITQVPAFWIALFWAAAALLGVVLLLNPVARNSIGVFFLLAEVTGASLASGSSFFTAIWQHIFNETELAVPPHAATGQAFTAELRLVPYRTVTGVSVSMALIDRHFRETGESLEIVSQNLGYGELLERGRLPGRLLGCGVPRQSADDVEPREILRCRPVRKGRTGTHRQKELHWLQLGTREPLRRHADDNEGALAEVDRTADHARITAEAALPTAICQHCLRLTFRAPYPVTQHTSTAAEINADVLSLLSFIVPALRFQANNLREHGGYFVEARVRVGPLSRRFHKRIIAYSMGATIEVG